MRDRLWRVYSFTLLAAMILAIPAILNGGPLWYWDTEGYISRPATVLYNIAPDLFDTHWVDQHRVSEWSAAGSDSAGARAPVQQWNAGRSIYWGTIAYGFLLLFGEWGFVVMNALLAGAVLSIAWFRCLDKLPASLFPPFVAVLTFLTPLGATVAFAMPDLLSALLIISLALLATCWRRLLTVDRVVLAGIACLAALSHDSHLAIAAMLLPLCLLAAFFIKDRPARIMSQAVVLALPLLAGIAGGAIFSMVAEARTGNPPLRLPHLSAHVTSLESGQRYLAEHCDAAEFVICRYADRLPVHWIDFLFDKSPDTGVFGAAEPSVKRQISDEQIRFMLAVAQKYPASLALELSRDGLWQLVAFDTRDMNPRAQEPYMRAEFPAGVYTSARESTLWQRPELIAALDWTTTATSLMFAGLIAGALFLHSSRAFPLSEQMLFLGGLIVLGLIANAIVCGVLASPLGRFQARVIWLVPFLGFPFTAMILQGWVARKENNHVFYE